ncbi:MAG: periplasmic heavy metal sensor [Sulfitobacter sp.]|nr:periplasmic heavy metal sensor [Sulfitobacter sp.]
MVETPSPPPPPRASRLVRWVLGLSLALNLIFVGFVVGAAFRFRDGGPGATPHPGAYAAAYVRALPRSDQRALRRALRREARPLVNRVERRAQYEAVLSALRAADFDPVAVKAALDRQAQMAQGIQRGAQRVWLERISAMTAAERAAYADRVEALLRRGPRRSGPPPSD